MLENICIQDMGQTFNVGSWLHENERNSPWSNTRLYPNVLLAYRFEETHENT
jgi:hypothetical protein